MLIYPNLNPIAFHLGPLSVHWYGLMYLLGFFVCWLILSWRIRVSPKSGFRIEQLSDLFFYLALGVIIGGRLGYVLFYDFSNILNQPLRIFAIWQGGMSFHGGLLGVVLAIWFYARKTGKTFLEIGDFIVPVIPIGLGLGRIGNFINGELWGRVTELAWGMVFPHVDNLPRHPSQLYEFFLEGVVMFIILWSFSTQSRPRGAISGLFLVLYGLFRILVEFFREPDQPMGYLAWGWLTEGQLLSFPMVIIGLTMMTWAYQYNRAIK